MPLDKRLQPHETRISESFGEGARRCGATVRRPLTYGRQTLDNG